MLGQRVVAVELYQAPNSCPHLCCTAGRASPSLAIGPVLFSVKLSQSTSGFLVPSPLIVRTTTTSVWPCAPVGHEHLDVLTGKIESHSFASAVSTLPAFLLDDGVLGPKNHSAPAGCSWIPKC